MPLIAPAFIRPLLDQPVGVFGAGVSGAAVGALLARLGVRSVIYDEKAAGFSDQAARLHRLVVFSPGFPPEHPWLATARAAGCECLGEIDFASLFWQGPLVAVTGTNGKTTLTKFLVHALRCAGRDVYGAGNVGRALASLAADTDGGAAGSMAICEVSSFQAETLKHLRAEATLWTNFAEDHLERHPTLEAYFGAKWNLVARTKPGAFFAGTSVQHFARKFNRPLTAAVEVATEGQPADARLAGTVFPDYPQRENFLLAAAWWRAAGLPIDALYAAAQGFRLEPHRLARVGEHDGVGYWNDSKATNFHAVEAALAHFAEPIVLIAGGRAKGGDLAGFVHRIAPRVKHAVLMGEVSGELAFHCAAFRVAHTTCGTLAEAVRRAADLAAPGDQVLLSPGFASFDMFRSYADRGEQFELLVRELGITANF